MGLLTGGERDCIVFGSYRILAGNFLLFFLVAFYILLSYGGGAVVSEGEKLEYKIGVENLGKLEEEWVIGGRGKSGEINGVDLKRVIFSGKNVAKNRVKNAKKYVKKDVKKDVKKKEKTKIGGEEINVERHPDCVETIVNNKKLKECASIIGDMRNGEYNYSDNYSGRENELLREKFTTRRLGSTDEALNATILMLVFMLVIANIASWAIHLLPFYQPPVSVTLFLLGIGVSTLTDWGLSPSSAFYQGVRIVQKTDPMIIFVGLLPIVLYASTLEMNYFVFKKVLPSSLFLAGPGVMLNSALTGVAMRYGIGWSWAQAMTCACLLSATDPVAVIASLSVLCAPEKLAAIIDGEAMLNDASAVVFFEVCRGILAGQTSTAGEIIGSFALLTVGGFVYGIAMGIVLYLWFTSFKTSFSIQVTASVVMVYFVFYTADHYLRLSGVLATVSFGVFVCAKGKMALHRELEHAHLEFVSFLSILAVQLIFLVGGIVSYRFFRDFCIDTSLFWGEAGGAFEIMFTYVVLHLTRGLNCVVHKFFFASSLGLSWKEATVVWWSGLRGIIAIALVLMIEQDKNIPLDAKKQISIVSIGVVILTIVLNGVSVEFLYTYLQLYPVTPFRRRYLTRTLCSLETQFEQRKSDQLYQHWLTGMPQVVDQLLEFLPSFEAVTMRPNGKIDWYTSSPALYVPIVAKSLLKSKTLISSPMQPPNRRASPINIAGFTARASSKDSEEHGSSREENEEENGEIKEENNQGQAKKKASAFRLRRLSVSVADGGIGKEVHLSTMILNAYRQMYSNHYHHFVVGGNALLALHTSIDEAIEYGERKAHEGVGTSHKETMIKVQWVGLQRSVDNYSKSSRCIFPDAHFNSVHTAFQILHSYIDAHHLLMQSALPILQDTVATELAEDFKACANEAKSLLCKLADERTFMYVHCLVLTTAHFILNMKETILNEQASRGVVLREDIKKLVTLMEVQRTSLRNFSPSLANTKMAFRRTEALKD